MNNRFGFGQSVLCLFLLLAVAPITLADCGQNAIRLKTGTRNWIKEYDEIFKNYAKKPVKVSALRIFFYNGQNEKECISPNELQSLNQLAQKNLGQDKLAKDDRNVKRFIAAIAAITMANPPSELDPSQPLNTTSVAAIDEPHSTTAYQKPFNDSERETLVSDVAFWKQVSLGLVALIFLLSGVMGMLLRRAEKRYKLQAWNHKQKLQSLAQLDQINQDKLERLGAKPTEQTSGNDIGLPKPNVPPDTPDQTQPDGQPVEEKRPEPKPNPQAIPAVAPFFLSTPTARPDGTVTFLDRRQEQFSLSSSVYRFRLRPDDSNQADFWFGEAPALVSAALAYPDTYLQPACNYNSLNTNAKKIITDKPGTAALMNDVWRVTRKAAIHFA